MTVKVDGGAVAGTAKRPNGADTDEVERGWPQRAPRNAFDFIDDEALEQRPPPGDLVAGLLPGDGLGVLIAKPNAGKTFFALEVAFCVGTDRPVLGSFPVKQGPVIFIAAEGGGHLRDRVRAWKVWNGVRGSCGVYFLTRPVRFDEPAQVRAFLAALQKKLATPPALIIVDTLARCLGGDENSAKDMNAFIEGLDLVREETGATILVVHHTARKATNPRGSSALEGAADTIMSLGASSSPKTHPRRRVLTCEKQKDAPWFDAIAMDLETVGLRGGRTSCRLVPVAGLSEAKGTSATQRLTATATTMLDTLRALGEDGATHGQWLKASKDAGVAKSTFNQTRTALLESGTIRKTDTGYAVA